MAEEEGGFEQKLESALSSRVQHFKENTDTLTLESVRRLLEKDLGLQKFALDAHKKFIRGYLSKEIQGTGDGNTEKASEDVEKDVNMSQEETRVLPEQHETKNGTKDSNNEDEKLMDDSPIMGVLAPKSETGNEESTVDESKIRKAIWKRADHFLANSESITLVGVRRLLEEDLGLENKELDYFKKFISQEIDQVLNSPEGAKPAEDFKKTAEKSKPAKDVKQKISKASPTKKAEKFSSGDESDSSGGAGDESESEMNPRKEAAPKRKVVKSKETKKRKISEESDHNVSSKKQKNTAKRQKEENASDEDGSTSQADMSQSSGGKKPQKNAKPSPGYGEQVDSLKSIIKACGMSVPPSIYKKAKQVPDDEREAFIVEELQGVLSKEGLSKNPTEKEIKDCRKRKERARELEGIDMSNIISSSRRRSSVGVISPPKPATSSKNEKVKAKHQKKKEISDNEMSDSNEKVKEEAEKSENDEKVEKKDDEEDVDEEEENDDGGDDDDEEDEEESQEFNEDDNEDSG